MNIPVELRYGTAVVPIAVPREKLLQHFRGPSGRALPVVSDAVSAVLRAPLDSPPLNRVLAPGDRLVLVLDAGLPQPHEIVVPVLDAMVNANVNPEDITILHAGDESYQSALLSELPTPLAEVRAARHDPEDSRNHAYLANTRSGQRIYLNRALVDADAVVIVGEMAFDAHQGYMGTASHLFPALSNAATQARARRQGFANRLNPELLRQRQGADEVAWLMGLFFALGLALDRDRAVETVWAGHYPSVQNAGVEHLQRHWTITPRLEPADLVVVTTSFRAEHAGWAEVGAALEVARQEVADGGTILVISDVDAPLGETGRWLAESQDPRQVLHRLQHPDAAGARDSLATAQCAAALEAARIHLFSPLAPETVEEMSMVPVPSPRAVEALVRGARACAIIEDADRVHLRGAARHPALYALTE